MKKKKKFDPTCFGLHKPSSESYSLLFAKVTIFIPIYKSLLEYSVLWLHISCALFGKNKGLDIINARTNHEDYFGIFTFPEKYSFLPNM